MNDDKDESPRKGRDNGNAITHGIYAKGILLPCESRESFDELLEGTRRTYLPSDLVENELVNDIAITLFKKRRLAILAQLGDPFYDELRSEKVKSWQDAIKYLSDRRYSGVAEPMSLHTTILLTLADRAVRQTKNVKTSEEATNSKRILDKALKNIEQATKTLVDEHKRFVKHREEIQPAFDPERFEKFVKLEMDLDRRLDRSMRIFYTHREFKNLSSQRMPTPALPMPANPQKT